MTPDRKRRLWIAVGIIAFSNFWAFFIGDLLIGGDAMNGYAADGHYYLYSQVHGPYAEVSRAVYTYSWWHAVSLVPTFVLFAIAAHFARPQRTPGDPPSGR